VAKEVKKLPSRDAKRLEDQLIDMLDRIHKRITLDASITPDAALWNQLMDTYQRLGLFAQTWAVWDQMYFAGQYDNTSVSVIFDACGHNGRADFAQQVYSRLSHDRFKFNLANFHSWIECVCRLGNLSEATRIVCIGMLKDPCFRHIRPDIETIRLLLSFARSPHTREQILIRIERHLPSVWIRLPESMKSVNR
jgi:hypothetical protein